MQPKWDHEGVVFKANEPVSEEALRERAKRARDRKLLDLFEILEFMTKGVDVTWDVVARLRACGRRHADRIYKDAEKLAHELGIDMRRTSDGQVVVEDVDSAYEVAEQALNKSLSPSLDKVGKQRERRSLYKQHGICVGCKAPAKPGFAHCEACLASARQRVVKQHRVRARRMARGLCYDCGSPRSDRSDTLCDFCLGYHAEKAAERRQRLTQEGLCITCGRVPPVEGQRNCSSCAETKAQWARDSYRASDAGRERGRQAVAEARAKGFCLRCRARPAAAGKSQCQHCLDTQQKKRDERRAAGLCDTGSCPNKAEPGRRKCRTHLDYYAERERAKKAS